MEYKQIYKCSEDELYDLFEHMAKEEKLVIAKQLLSDIHEARTVNKINLIRGTLYCLINSVEIGLNCFFTLKILDNMSKNLADNLDKWKLPSFNKELHIDMNAIIEYVQKHEDN